MKVSDGEGGSCSRADREQHSEEEEVREEEEEVMAPCGLAAFNRVRMYLTF